MLVIGNVDIALFHYNYVFEIVSLNLAEFLDLPTFYRYSEDGSSTSNSSSGYGSNGGTISRYHSLKERRNKSNNTFIND